MSLFLRLIGRKRLSNFSSSTDSPCFACTYLRNRYSTNSQLLRSIHSGKRKKRVKKKAVTDTEKTLQRKLELTQVLDRHVENLRTLNPGNHSGKQKVLKRTGLPTAENVTFIDKDMDFKKFSLKPHRPSISTLVSASDMEHSNDVSSLDYGYLENKYSDNEKVVKAKRRPRRERKEPPNVSFQTTHFSEYSRDNVKQSFAFNQPKTKSKESAPDVTNTLSALLNRSYQQLEQHRANEAEATYKTEPTVNENDIEVQDLSEDGAQTFPRYFVRRKDRQSKLLSQAELYEMEMARDTHLEKLEEPDMFEIDVPDVLYEPVSIEGQITKKAEESLEREKEKQHKLELKKILQSKTPEESINQIMKARKTQEFNADIRSYVDACVSCGLLQRALSDVNTYRSQFREARSLTPITDVDIYNILLKGLARAPGNKAPYLYEAKKVFSWIHEDGLKPTMESYCFSLLCLEPNSKNYLLMSTFILKDMQQQGFDPREAFNQCNLKSTEIHQLRQLFKLLIPDYKASPVEPLAEYDSPLLETLKTPLPISEVAQVNSLAGSLTADEALKQAETQFAREIDIYVKIHSIYPPFKTKMEYDRMINHTVEGWKASIKEELIKMKMDLKRKALVKEGLTIYPFLCLFPLDDYVHILTMEAQQMAMYSQYYSPQLPEIYDSIARHIHARYMVQVAQDTGIFKKLYQVYKEYIENLLDPSMPCHNQRVTWKQLEKKFQSSKTFDQQDREWSNKILKGVGKSLMKVILKGTKIDTNIFQKDSLVEKYAPCFYEVTRVRSGKACAEIMPHPKIFELMNPVADLTFPTESLPMLCPPIPYTSSTFGGSFINTTDLVRRCSPDQTKMFKDMSPEAAPVFDSLNILSASAWQINKPVLSVAIQVFRQGGNSDIDIPILPASIKAPEKPSTEEEEDRMVMREYNKQKRLYNKTFAEATSLWWTMLYKLSIANTYKNDTFWFPMNMDFRGRTYTVAPHLNHQGDDVNRGLIQFAKGKALGEDGLKWLKIHLINLTGLKKRCSNTERLEYCEQIMPSIIDSADNPLTGERWWMESEEPWQTLAACMEIVNATRSGNPAEYVSKVPVHQDGSCNGLQHYAALGRDEMGAKSVNLHPLEIPSDVYTEVLELVMKEIERDIAENTSNAKLAQISQEFIERKVIKQSVMTTVYGVTAYGARQQIMKQLKYKKMDEKHLMQISTYLTEKTFNSLNEMFTSAKHIQDWFNACARQMSALDMRMEWVTPLNFPVIQPYQKPIIHNEKALPVAEEGLFKVDKRKQLNAFAPNFIHSLDATHMMLTALYCHRAGITFTSVHDCFWTHPAYIDVMNKITREQFVSLYQQPILEGLSQYLIKKVKERLEILPDAGEQNMEDIENVLSAVPGTGNFELEKVLKSTYFFS